LWFVTEYTTDAGVLVKDDEIRQHGRIFRHHGIVGRALALESS
jgi:hypothetical protein